MRPSEGDQSLSQFPLNVKPIKGPGRPKGNEGRGRYPSGDLRPAGPNAELLARRAAIAADPAMAENPLDAAYSNGWLERDHWRAGKLYARVHGVAYRDSGGPRVALSTVPESAREGGDQPSVPDLHGLTIDEVMSRLYRMFAEGAPGTDPQHREDQTAAAMAKLRVMNAAMSAAQRAEVHLVCVLDSWPQWFVHRQAGAHARLTYETAAIAEKRGLNEAELAHLAFRFNSPWERKRDLLVGGLRACMRAVRPDVADLAILPVPQVRFGIPAPSRSNGTVEVYIRQEEGE